jgi:hypothetical protein
VFDRDDPACGLPRGRCAICGSPCRADHFGTEVCPGCVPTASAFHELDGAGHPDGPGWRLAGVAGDGSAHIERDPRRVLFSDDEAAGADVVGRIVLPAVDGARDIGPPARP